MWRWLVVSALALVVGMGYAVWFYQDTQRTLRITITDANTILPTTINLVRGQRDTLVIANQSTQPVTVAGSVIAPHQEFRQYYRSVGDFSFTCSLHGGQSLHVIVRDP
jgi:hypothetical protein